MKIFLHFWVGIVVLAALSPSRVSASLPGSEIPFERTAPSYQLPNHPNPSLDELIQGLEEHRARDGNDPELWYQLGLSYAQANRRPEALAALQNALKLNPRRAGAWENLGICLYLEQRPDEAMAAFAKATELGPSDPVAWSNYGLMLMEKDRLAESDAALAKGFQLTNKLQVLWNSLGLLREKQGQLQPALDAFQQGVQIDPNDAKIWTNLGGVQEKLGKRDDAVVSGLRATQLDPQLGPAWLNLATAYGDKGQWNDAYAAAQKATSLEPGNAGAWLVIADCASKVSKREESVEDFQKAINELNARQNTMLKDDRFYVEVLSEYGLAAIEIEHLDDAEKILEEASGLDPKSPLILAAIGELRNHQKRWPEALEATQQSLAISPNVARTWQNLGVALWGENKNAEALEAYQKATALSPTYGPAWFGQGQTDELLGKPADAVPAYRKAVECEPALDQAWERLAILTSDPDEADKAAAQLIALAPNDAIGYETLGFLQLRRKNWPAAEAAFRKSTALKDNPEVWGLLGDVFLGEKNNAEAASAFGKAIQDGAGLPGVELAGYWSKLSELHRLLAQEKGEAEMQLALDAINHATALNSGKALYWYQTAQCQKGLGHEAESNAAALKCQQLGGVPGIIAGASAPAGASPGETDQQKDALAQANAIRSLVKDHQFEQALAAAQHETELHPDHAVAWFSLGDVLMDERRYDEAIAALTKANALDPKMGPTWYDLGNCLALQGKMDEAIDDFTMSINLMPNYPANWVALYRCYGPPRSFGEGEAKLQGLVQAHPDSAFGWWVLGDMQSTGGTPDVALAALQKSVDLRSDYAPAWNSLGLAYAKLQKLDKALECFTRAVQVQPGYDEALNNVGYTNFVMGQTDKAIDFYKEALQANPRHKRALFNLVTAYAQENQWESARQSCDALAQVDPGMAAGLRQKLPNIASNPAPATVPQ